MKKVILGVLLTLFAMTIGTVFAGATAIGYWDTMTVVSPVDGFSYGGFYVGLMNTKFGSIPFFTIEAFCGDPRHDQPFGRTDSVFVQTGTDAATENLIGYSANQIKMILVLGSWFNHTQYNDTWVQLAALNIAQPGLYTLTPAQQALVDGINVNMYDFSATAVYENFSDGQTFFAGDPLPKTPEPGTLVLFGTAILGLGVSLRRRT